VISHLCEKKIGDDVNGDVDFSTNVASSTACCELCRVTKHCRFWTFSTPERGRQAHHCWLKNKHVKPYRRTGAHGLVSGYLKSRKDSTATSDQTKKKKEKRDATRQHEVKTAKKPREGKTAKDATHTQEEKKEKTAMKNAKKAKELVEQAQALYHKGMARDAEAVLRRAIEKDGTYGNARMWMGFVLEQLGRWQGADADIVHFIYIRLIEHPAT
jgi:tetratricopeptide (TPR) repeat protein